MRLAHTLAVCRAFGRQDGEHWGHCSVMPEKISSVAPDPSREGTLWSPSLLSREARGAREERRACEWNLRRKGRQKVTSASGHTEEGAADGGPCENFVGDWTCRSLFTSVFGFHGRKIILSCAPRQLSGPLPILLRPWLR